MRIEPVRLAGIYLRITALATLLLSGCTQTVQVDLDVPTPLIVPLPMKVAVYLHPSMKDYKHLENVPLQSNWNLRLDDANALMFDKLLGSMFREVIKVDSRESAFAMENEVDAVIVASIEDLQVAPPKRLESEFFETWIQYRIEAYDKARAPIVDWKVSGYGRSEAGMFGKSDALKEATVMAMRDAAASIVIKFKRQPRVKEWILQQEQADAPPGS